MANHESDGELEALREQLRGLSGPSNKKKRSRVNQQIRDLLEKRHDVASAAAADTNVQENHATNTTSTAPASSTRNSPSSSIVLDANALPPFRPSRAMVETVNRLPTPALEWAFVANVPPLRRPPFMGMGGSGGLIGANAHPAAQWNYSMFHLAHHYQESYRKFIIQDDDQTEGILLEVTALRACPESQGVMKELAREDYACVMGPKEKLGAIPIFFVRYLYSTRSMNSAHKNAIKQFMGGPIVTIHAVSVEEIQFGYSQLHRGESFVAQKGMSSNITFRRSVIFPASMQELDTELPHAKADYLCAMCNMSLPMGKRQSCARCKVTYYCSRDCQRQHWRGHKQFCTPVGASNDTSNNASKSGNSTEATRPSFRFLVNTENPDTCYMFHSYTSGSLTTSGLTKDMRRSLGRNVHKTPTPRNAHGDSEFIVKVQPPHDPSRAEWMVYDGPTRSFQCLIAPETEGLVDCYQKIVRDGISSVHPLLGSICYKAYCTAKWEGPHIRVFFDRFAPQQQW